MPTPPLPSRDDDEHGAMPADCRVETLRAWLATNECVDHADMARTVRALVEAKCAEVLEAASDEHCYATWVGKSHIDTIVSRVLGGAP